jgi:hypothetical protein
MFGSLVRRAGSVACRRALSSGAAASGPATIRKAPAVESVKVRERKHALHCASTNAPRPHPLTLKRLIMATPLRSVEFTCARARVRVCVRVCVRACVCACVCSQTDFRWCIFNAGSGQPACRRDGEISRWSVHHTRTLCTICSSTRPCCTVLLTYVTTTIAVVVVVAILSLCSLLWPCRRRGRLFSPTHLSAR